jgi:hypothetical protein
MPRLHQPACRAPRRGSAGDRGPRPGRGGVQLNERGHGAGEPRPDADSCEEAENDWADAPVVLLDDVQGILSINEPESWDARTRATAWTRARQLEVTPGAGQ